MGKIQFNIPDDVVRRFEEVFEGQDKDAVVTELLRKAVEAGQPLPAERKMSLVEQMREMHAKASRSYSDEEIREIREELRR